MALPTEPIVTKLTQPDRKVQNHATVKPIITTVVSQAMALNRRVFTYSPINSSC